MGNVIIFLLSDEGGDNQTEEMLSAACVDKINYKEFTVTGSFILTFFEGEPLCAEN